METTSSLQTADYVVIIFLLLVSLGIGVLFAVEDFRKTNRVEYLLGGRRMSVLPVSLSLFATLASGISLLGFITECYLYGAMANMAPVGVAIGYLLAAFTVVPLLHPLRLTSLYDYHQLRFNSEAVRMFVLLVGMLQTLFYMAIALLAPALALQTGAGLPLWVSVGVVGAIGTVYTAIGGIKSVIWTDALQSVVMVIGILTVIIKGTSIVGGPGAVFQIAREGGRLNLNDFSPDPRARNTWWATVIGGCFFCLINICSQSSLLRISSMKSIRNGQRAFSLTGVMFVFYTVLLVGTGSVMFVYYTVNRCDPLKVGSELVLSYGIVYCLFSVAFVLSAGLIANANQLPPYFVTKAMRDFPGVAGMYMATVFSASLSTISSGMSSLAANTVEDLLRKPLQNVQEGTITFITKLLVLFYGTLIMGLSYGASFLQASISQIVVSISGACGGPLVGIFMLGALFPWANKYGAIGGGVLALVFNMWIALGKIFYGRKYTVLALPSTEMCFYNFTWDNFANSSVLLTNTQDTHSFKPAYNVSKMNSAVNVDWYGSDFSFYDISFHWYSFYGTLASLVLGIVISYFTRRYSEPVVDEKTLFPFVRSFWFSKSPQETCDDGVDEDNCMIKLQGKQAEKTNLS